MESLKKYPHYKPSNTPWIGDVPEHWEVKKLKWVVTKVGSGVTPSGGASTYQNEGIPLLRSQNIHDDGLRLDDVAFISEEVDEQMSNSRIQEGDVLLNITGASIGRSFYVPADFGRGNVNQHVCIIRPNLSFIETRFLHAILTSGYGQTLIDSFQNGANREGLNFQQIRSFDIPLPPLPEQTRIARYLDDKTAQIDHLIAAKQRLLALLREERSAVINRAVTRGLDPAAKMKPSGVPWLGEVPEGWAVKKLKYLFSFEKGKNAAQYTSEYVGQNPGIFPIFSGQTENEGIMGAIDSYEYEFNSVLFVTTVGAKAMTVKRLEGNFSLSQNCAIIIKKDEKIISDAFYHYYLQRHFDYERGRISLIMQPSLRFEDLNSYYVLFPPIKEQVAIGQYLIEKEDELERAAQKITAEIALLQEYRVALISAAVTGRIRISD